MIAAISLMRRLESVDLTTFRRHWLDIHGPLVCSFPGLRRYVQCHVIGSPVTSEAARSMRIDGFPILFFDNDTERSRAHGSPEMAACNVDSRSFIGAVSRVITRPVEVVPLAASHSRISAIVLYPDRIDPGPIERRLGSLAGSRGLTRYDVLEQGPAPASTVPHLPVTVAGLFQIWFDSLIDLECAAIGIDAPVFVVEEHWLA